LARFAERDDAREQRVLGDLGRRAAALERERSDTAPLACSPASS
jgi:hypothetical protein